MKEIKTNNYIDQKKQADLMTHPPVPGETESTSLPKKKKKKIYQLNRVVDAVDVDI